MYLCNFVLHQQEANVTIFFVFFNSTDMYIIYALKTNGSFTLHGTGNGNGTGNGTGNDGFKYFAMYCSHYTGTGTGNGNGDHWVPLGSIPIFPGPGPGPRPGPGPGPV